MKTHGLSRTPEHRIWLGMRRRCKNKNQVNYARYGGRGVTVCKGWDESFEAFLADVGPRPSPQHSLERKKNELGYQPGNVCWATDGEQNRNMRTNVWVEMNGRRQILKDWARELGVSYKRVSERIVGGWDPVEALTTPALPVGTHRKRAG
jgi:hypothetical protein